MTADVHSPALVRGWRPGLLGQTVDLHARRYARAWGFGPAFEATVAAGMAAFLARYDPATDLVLSSWEGETLRATLTLDGADASAPQGWVHLRWFIAAEAAEGRGLGARLMADAMAFLDARDAPCFLDTFAGLDVARALYERHGFRLTAEAEGETWGTRVREQRFERCTTR